MYSLTMHHAACHSINPWKYLRFKDMGQAAANATRAISGGSARFRAAVVRIAGFSPRCRLRVPFFVRGGRAFSAMGFAKGTLSEGTASRPEPHGFPPVV